MRRYAVLPGVIQKHLVELAANHLPGLRTLVRPVVPKVKGRRAFAAWREKLNAVFLDEIALLHLRQHVQAVQDPVRFGNQRFTDVKAWESFPLEEFYATALLSDEGGHRRAGRPATDNNDVRMICAHHLFIRYSGFRCGVAERISEGENRR